MATTQQKPPTTGSGTGPAWGAWVVIVGMSAIVLVFGLSILRFNKAADVATAMGAVTGVIAALVGAYFGIRGATLAQSQAMSANDTTGGVEASTGSNGKVPPPATTPLVLTGSETESPSEAKVDPSGEKPVP